MRGAIERRVIRAVARGTYFQLWWPSFDVPLFMHRSPVFIDGAYRDPDTGHALKTWEDRTPWPSSTTTRMRARRM